MKIWKVELIEEAKEDFQQLDGSQKRLVLKQFIKLEQEPKKYGKPLGNKAGYDLTGYYKLYADKETYPQSCVCLILPNPPVIFNSPQIWSQTSD